MIPVTIELQPAKHGDKWQGIVSIGPVLFNGQQPTFPLSRLRLQFWKDGELGMTLDSNVAGRDGPVVISNATTWLAHIPALQPLPLTVGNWEWTAEFYEGNDTAPQTYYDGVLTVTNDR